MQLVETTSPVSDWARWALPDQDHLFDLGVSTTQGQVLRRRPPLSRCNPLARCTHAPQQLNSHVAWDPRAQRGIPHGPPTSCVPPQLNSSRPASSLRALFSSSTCCRFISFSFLHTIPSFGWVLFVVEVVVAVVLLLIRAVHLLYRPPLSLGPAYPSHFSSLIPSPTPTYLIPEAPPAPLGGYRLSRLTFTRSTTRGQGQEEKEEKKKTK